MPALTMPNIGEGVTEGTVTKWLKAEGDSVAMDEPVVEVETDKAIVEIPSPFAGVLTRIIVAEGQTVPIGEPLAEFDGSGGKSEAHTPQQVAAAASASAPGSSVPAAASRTTADAHNGNAPPGEFRRTRGYSPVVLKLASEHNIDLSLVQGTGIDGRVTKQDVLRYIENPSMYTVPPPSGAGVVGAERRAASTPSPAATAAPAHAPAPAPASGGELVPLSATRRTIAAHMTQSHQSIPVAWMMVEADVTALVQMRERAKQAFEQREGVKLTFLPFFIEALAAALREHPLLNATYEEGGLRMHDQVHIGVAVATDSGLLVPVLRNAADLSLAGIAREVAQLAEKAQARKLTVDEMRGATCTIDNTGAFGSIISKPIVPTGQVAIVTTEMIRRELRPSGADAFGVRSVINLCISFDHRAIDGADAGRFMQSLRQRVEAPREP